MKLNSNYTQAKITFLGVLVFVMMSLCLSFYFSTQSRATENLPEGLRAVQAEYKKSAGIMAQFEQFTEIKATKQKKKH